MFRVRVLLGVFEFWFVIFIFCGFVTVVILCVRRIISGFGFYAFFCFWFPSRMTDNFLELYILLFLVPFLYRFLGGGEFCIFVSNCMFGVWCLVLRFSFMRNSVYLVCACSNAVLLQLQQFQGAAAGRTTTTNNNNNNNNNPNHDTS